jgi:hypothetical protein
MNADPSSLPSHGSWFFGCSFPRMKIKHVEGQLSTHRAIDRFNKSNPTSAIHEWMLIRAHYRFTDHDSSGVRFHAWKSNTLKVNCLHIEQSTVSIKSDSTSAIQEWMLIRAHYRFTDHDSSGVRFHAWKSNTLKVNCLRIEQSTVSPNIIRHQSSTCEWRAYNSTSIIHAWMTSL